MRLLSFDTSTSSLSVAILEDSELVEEVIVPPAKGDRQEAVTKLLPTIDGLLKNAGWQKEELSHICVGIGPGSFTGTRIGVVTARSLAQGLDLPLLGVNRFLCLAQYLSTNAGIILDGGRNHLFVASYLFKDGELSLDNPLIEPCDLNYAQLPQLLNAHSGEVAWFAQGSVLELGIFEEFGKESIKELPDLREIASIQAKIAQKLLNSSNNDSSNFPIEAVKPLYLRGASITLKQNASKSSPTKS